MNDLGLQNPVNMVAVALHLNLNRLGKHITNLLFSRPLLKSLHIRTGGSPDQEGAISENTGQFSVPGGNDRLPALPAAGRPIPARSPRRALSPVLASTHLLHMEHDLISNAIFHSPGLAICVVWSKSMKSSIVSFLFSRILSVLGGKIQNHRILHTHGRRSHGSVDFVSSGTMDLQHQEQTAAFQQ